RRAGAPTHPTAPLFWSPHQRPYSLVGLQAGISRLLSTVCGKRPGRGTGPRAHDIRHAFAVHRLLRWYREGADVQAKLPLLATYLGHCTFLSAQYYLTATPERSWRKPLSASTTASGRWSAYRRNRLDDVEHCHARTARRTDRLSQTPRLPILPTTARHGERSRVARRCCRYNVQNRTANVQCQVSVLSRMGP